MTAHEHKRAWQGIAFLSYGFRPFFFSAGLLSALLMLVWIPVYLGFVGAPSALGALNWHVHEMLFGYVPAVIAGFLLTAVPNWTGRPPITGWPLAGLFAVWLAGRVAVTGAAPLPPAALACVALGFPLALGAMIGRELVAARNWRNLKVLAALGLLTLAQGLFYLEWQATGRTDVSSRIGIAATMLLITIVAGRIVPIFTRNWIIQNNPGREPVLFNAFDRNVMILGGLALAGWCAAALWPQLGSIAAPILLAAALGHAWRLTRWAPQRTGREMLVAILHIAYAFIPLGFALAGMALWSGDPASHQAAIHAWTTGAIGLMTLAVMTRATRGHSGRPLTASPGTVVIYALVFAAAVLRIALAFLPGQTMMLMPLSGLAWSLGFLLFCILYAPMLLRR